MKVKFTTFFCLFLFFLPFTQALTINIGFPLKGSELLLMIMILLYMLVGYVSKEYLYFVLNSKALVFFLIWALFSFVINSFWQYEYPLKKIPFRISAFGDSFLRLCYIILNIIAFFISLFFISRSKSILKYWVIGAVIAACYSWYLFIFSALGFPYIKLFGMESSPQNLFGIIRCGTFREGNFFGLFLILSSAVAFFNGKAKTGWFLLFTIITTMSTISIVCGGFFLIYIYRKKLFTGKVLIIYPLIFIIILFSTRTEFFQYYVKAKIFQPVSHLTNGNFSKVDRYLTGRIAFKQGIDNPLIGVGPYNYALHYDYYNDYKKVVKNPSEWFDDFIIRKNKRGITNNVYLEVWSEYGIVGFFLFIVFLGKTLILAFKNKNDIITGGIIAILISFNAFPSFIMLFIWVFLAIPYAINYQKRII
ncbi:O-antigen ligase family protein [Sabulilitoribacter arenilitoris]|uniref:O-antigen ligase family protein n=1 Tax=Wocania arenilitoris TaxID=2044858 RepID=A0AAE3EMY3_9FLAO|nr:O-antigen ligase family protein [Wocania arenilitoris]MCF7566775.1 O-antigen ligase family protein [Wocania arenilitoris]